MSEYFVGSTGANNQTNFSSLDTSEVLDDLGLNTGDSPTFSGLFLEGSGSTIFSVDGSNGRLFGVTDEVTGTVFSVNDAAGLPIIEVESTSSYDKLTLGEYGSDLLVLSGQNTIEITGSQIASQSWVGQQGFITSETDDQNLNEVLAQGNSSSYGISVNQITGTALTIDTDTLFVDSTNNRVGIGTNSPNVPLEVHGADITSSSNTTAVSVLRLVRDITDSSYTLRKDSAVDFMLSRQQASANNLPYTRLDIRLAGTTDSSTPSLDVMSLLHNGNVGIGITDPDEKLEIDGNIKIGADKWYRMGGDSFQIGADGASNGMHFHAGGSEKLTILAGGNVGIGTTSPAVDLEIKTATNSSSAEEGLRLYNAGGGIGAGVRIGLGVGATYNEKGHIRTDIVNGGAGRLFLGSNGTDRLVINENGKVLVNGAEDNSGKADFAVSGGTVLSFRNNQVQMGGSDMNWDSKIFDDGQAKWSAWDRNIQISSTGSNTGSATARDIIFSPQTSGTAASTERMRIKGSGNVGIGTTSPSERLHIHNSTGNSATIRLSDPDSTSTANATGYVEVYHGENTSRAGYFGLITNSEMALATTTSAGNIKLYTGNNTVALTINSSQNATFAGDLTVGGDTILNGGLEFGGNIPAATTDTDTFLVVDSGALKYRTGAQVLSDIGGLSSETVTSLALTSGSLVYTDESGTANSISLAAYLDEDSRSIASGSLNSTSGIVTFTRDDSTTFTLDLGDLLDDTNLVASVAGKSGVVSLVKGDVGLGNVTNESKATMFSSPSFTGDVVITDDTFPFIRSSTNAAGAGIKFSDKANYGQYGTLTFRHSDSQSYGSGSAFILGTSETTSTILADGKLMYGEGIYSKPASGTGAGTRKDSNWDTAYTHTSATNNPHSVTATQVGLGNVTNESKATMFTSPTFTGGGNTATLKKGTGNAALAFAGTSDQASALIEGIAGGGLKIYTSNGGTLNSPSWSTKMTIAAAGNTTFTGTVSAPNLTLSSLSAQTSELTALMINGSNVVGTRELGSAAFSATSAFAAASHTQAFSTITSTPTTVAGYGITDAVSTSALSSYLPLAGGTIDGSLIIDTDTSAQPFYITRSGATDQSLKIYVDDQNAIFESIQDETADDYGGFIFNMDVGTTHPYFDVRKNNSTIMRVDGGGNVGIGTTSPSNKLDIAGGLEVNAEAYIRSTNNVGLRIQTTDQGTTGTDGLRVGLNATHAFVWQYENLPLAFATNGSQKATILANGNFGIGNAAPSYKLDVNGDFRVVNAATFSAGTYFDQYLYHAGDTDTFIRFQPNDVNLTAAGQNLLRVDGNSTQKTVVVNEVGIDVDFRVEASGEANALFVRGSDGNVGIGTTTPKNKLDISLNSGQWRVNDYGSMYFANTSDTGYERYIHSRSDGALSIGRVAIANLTGGTGGYAATTYDHIHINSSGEVGIGTTSPSHKLEVGLTSTVSLANQPAEPLHVSNNAQSVDGRVFISVKHDVVNTASAVGAGFKMTAAAVTSGTASYDDSLIFLRSAGTANDTVHSAPKAIKFYVDNHATNAGSGANYADLGDLALTIAEDTNATFGGNIIAGGAVYPATNAAASLGLSNKQWAGLDLSSSAAITWGNGDAEIVEGETNNYSLTFKTYDGSSNSAALRLDGDNTATFTGNVNINSVFDFNTSTDLLTITNNQNTGGINLSGGNSRIYFGGSRAIEGDQSGGTLYIGEGYGAISLMDDVTVSGDLTVSGEVEFSGISSGSAAPFVVSDGGTLSTRTAAEVLDDIGGKITKKISGDGTTTTFTVTHSFGTPHVMTQLLDYGNNGTGATYEVVQTTVKRNSDNAIDIVFGSAPTSSEDYLALITKMPAIS